MYSVYGVENPLMDVIAHVDAGLLRRFGKIPGTMHLVEYSDVMALLARDSIHIETIHRRKRGKYRSRDRLALKARWDGMPLRESILPAPRAEDDSHRKSPSSTGAIGRDPRGDLFVRGSR